MSTNHNRIRVADLETSQPNKILKTNQNGELEFSDASNLQAENYNALDCTAEGKTLDARQGKVLKDMIDNINVVPPSLVNDLTTGGTTKALTAEMGKQLNFNKLTATLATDEETQTTIAVAEDNKVVSRFKLFNWWNNIISKTQTIKAIWNFNSGIKASETKSWGTEYTTKMSTEMLEASQYSPGYGTLKTQYTSAAIFCYYPSGNYVRVSFANEPTQINFIEYPNKSGTIALESDLKVKGQFSNRTAALAGGLAVGDYYNLPISGDNKIICVV